MRASRFAPAKVNLFLHVGPVDAEGYHPIASLMSFADVGDRLVLEPADRLGFDVVGAFADALNEEGSAGNLALRATERLLAVAGISTPRFRLVLEKNLPIAAGLGGGSSDAGAALKLVRDALRLTVDDRALESIAAELGADGPACLAARPVLATGRGERLSPAPALPVLPAVLVNPRVACPTGQVYRAYDALGGEASGADTPPLSTRYDTAEAAIGLLAGCRNDLEAPAIKVAPVVAEVLDLIRAAPETGLARLSGSGATAFALCRTEADAQALAARIQAARPNWWVRPCRIGGPWPA